MVVMINVGALNSTFPADLLSAVAEPESGDPAGDPSGDDIGGAGADEISGVGLGDNSGVGDGAASGTIEGAGDGDFPNNSVGRSRESTVKMQSGVLSRTVPETLEASTPVSKVTESPAVVTVKSYLLAPLLAKVLIGAFEDFKVPIGV
ncbi:hypothetical protein AQUCO_01300535v1 [Aquilegia coerulea]|uniref:Uncharacterized protein n=1 Tax=Aquilegia coerulea TaxID=218851 RepID=A0A2G5E2C2_AQUCA|nr:hypothetical protein AQUCO_01300535v1 [Aquilegia coerulea]